MEKTGICPTDDFVWKLMEDRLYMHGVCPAVSRGRRRCVSHRKSGIFQAARLSLYGFIRYIDNMRKRKIDMAQPNITSDSDDTVG